MAINVVIHTSPVLCNDDIGFPRVDWYEDRFNKKQVGGTAFITSGPNQVLYFASDGGILSDQVYRMRPWEKLVGFRIARANDIYKSNKERRAQEELARHSIFFRVTMANDAIVILADVADEYSSIPMHVSYGEGTPVEIEELHSTLHKHFILRRQPVIDNQCNGEYLLPRSVDPWRVTNFGRVAAIKGMTEAEFKKRSSFLGGLFGSKE